MKKNKNLHNETNDKNIENDVSLNNKNSKKEKGESKKTTLKSILSGTFTAILIVFVFFSGYFTHYFMIDKDLKSINFVLNTYRNHYYDPTDKNLPDALVEGLMDQYSQYFTPEEYLAYTKAGAGQRSGIGFSITQDMEVVTILGNSPAELAGIKKGDKILSYKGEKEKDFITATTGQNFIDYVKTISTNGKIFLKIDRNGENLSFTLTKMEYQESYVYYTDITGSYVFRTIDNKMTFVKSEEVFENIASGYGYIKLTSFDGSDNELNGATGQFLKALEKFKENGNHNLIVDLRDNGGGYLRILEQISAHLCYDSDHPTGKFLCQKAIYNNNQEGYSYAPQSHYKDYNFTKITFLANIGSASASEALMGVVLDYDKKLNKNIVKVIIEPTVIDDVTYYRTYGKGIMQSTFENKITGEALKLTTAEIHWPVSNICIHGVGLNSELDERIINFEVENEDIISYAQSI